MPYKELKKPSDKKADEKVHSIWIGLGKAAGGALIFSLPIMMTMEMWNIGASIHPLRLFALTLLSVPIYYRLSVMIGFRNTKTSWDSLIDVLVAYFIAFFTSGIVLAALGVITLKTHPSTIYSMILLQTVPGSLGALLARDLVSEGDPKANESGRNYRDDLVVFAAGALFLAFNLAPTEEMELIAYMMTPWHALALLALTLLLMHAFSLANSNVKPPELMKWSTQLTLFIRLTTVGYLISVIISIAMLFIFGNPENYDTLNLVKRIVVLGFPAGIGAAASRMIL